MTFTAQQSAVLNPAASTTQYLTSLRTVCKKSWNVIAASPTTSQFSLPLWLLRASPLKLLRQLLQLLDARGLGQRPGEGPGGTRLARSSATRQGAEQHPTNVRVPAAQLNAFPSPRLPSAAWPNSSANRHSRKRAAKFNTRELPCGSSRTTLVASARQGL